MSEIFKTPFGDNTGELTIQYEGTKGTTEAPVSADCNCGQDRSVVVSIETLKGGPKVEVTINQEGVREQFIPTGESEGMKGRDGKLFLGIKEKFANPMPECCQ